MVGIGDGLPMILTDAFSVGFYPGFINFLIGCENGLGAYYSCASAFYYGFLVLLPVMSTTDLFWLVLLSLFAYFYLYLANVD